MNKKSTVVAMFVFVATCLMGCGSGSHGSMFGDIPGIYEKKLVEVSKSIKDVAEKNDGDLQAAMGTLAQLKTAIDEADKEAQPIADQMVGSEVKVEVEDNMPFKVVGNAKVTSVKLPKLEIFNGGNSQMCLELTIEAEATGSIDQTPRQYYFLMDGETPICYGNCTFNGMAEGKTANVTMKVYAPEAPAEQIDRCSSIKFVSKATFESQKEAIDKQLKEWNDKMANDLGYKK